jgi:hypothetical protein
MDFKKENYETKDQEALSPERSNPVGAVEDYETAPPASNLRRELKSRQVNMLAIAGAIGTGLIIGSGQGLARGGPASLFIAYCITGSIIYFVMTALGEMASLLPMDQGFNGYATRFVDPALGYVTDLVDIVPLMLNKRQLCHRLELLLQIRHCSCEQLERSRSHYSVLETGLEDSHLGDSLWRCNHRH